MRFYLVTLLAITLFSCSRKSETSCDFYFNRNVEQTKLPGTLKEISGITFLSKNKIACVQDEKGVVYIYDIHKDKLRESIDFAGDKDYEAIANVNDTIYVLRSNGDIYEIDDLESDHTTSITHHTFLSKINNSEGMCYDPKNHRLLIACKGKPEKGTAKKYLKAVYGFDLSTKTLAENPVLVIDPVQIIELANQSEPYSIFSRTTRVDQFDPAEIAIDPVTGHYFILSSVGKRIGVFSENGSLICAVNLDEKIYKQPEGLAFNKAGNLVISDEGRNGKANLVLAERKLTGVK